MKRIIKWREACFFWIIPILILCIPLLILKDIEGFIYQLDHNLSKHTIEIIIIINMIIVCMVPFAELALITHRIRNKKRVRINHCSLWNIGMIIIAFILFGGLIVGSFYNDVIMGPYALFGPFFYAYRNLIVKRVFYNPSELIIGNNLYSLEKEFIVEKGEGWNTLILKTDNTEYSLLCNYKTSRENIMKVFNYYERV